MLTQRGIEAKWTAKVRCEGFPSVQESDPSVSDNDHIHPIQKPVVTVGVKTRSQFPTNNLQVSENGLSVIPHRSPDGVGGSPQLIDAGRCALGNGKGARLRVLAAFDNSSPLR